MTQTQPTNSPWQHYRIATPHCLPQGAHSLLNLPLGSQLTDGRHHALIHQPNLAVDIHHWQLNSLELQLPSGTPAPASVQWLTGAHGQQRLTPLALLPLPPAAIHLTGLPQGSRLTDGQHSLTATHHQQVHNLLGWQLHHLQLQPPLGWHQPIHLQLEPQNLTTTQTTQLSRLRLRLLSPNAYRNNTTHARTKTPTQTLHLQNLTPTQPPSLQISIGQGSQAIIQTQGKAEWDDEGLAALERKVRG